MRAILVVLAVAFAAAGCAGQADGGGAAGVVDRSAEPSPTSQVPAVPEVREDTILIEGMPEMVQTRPVQPPERFPVPFSTRAPVDMVVVPSESDSVRFEAAFGGQRSPGAALTFAVLPEDDEQGARRAFSGLAESLGVARRETERHPWAVEEYRLGGSHGGFLALVRSGGRWGYFLARYPPEFAEGMGPRVDLILDQWRWGDGQPLRE